MEYSKTPLLEVWVKSLRLPWYAATVIIAAVLLGAFILAAFLDGDLGRPLTWEFWRMGLLPPAIVVYIFGIYPVISRMGKSANESLQSLLRHQPGGANQPSSAQPGRNRRGEWAALLVGVVLVLALSQPWGGFLDWLSLYLELVNFIVFSLLALLIYYGLRDTRTLTRFSRKIDLDIFNVDVLTPLARWSLSIALAFVGGIVISIIFQTIESLRQWQVILIYGILILATIAIFFVMLWNTHNMISRAKKNELSFVAQKLTAAARDLKRVSDESSGESGGDRYYAVAAWGIYERRIREIKEWPFNAGIISRLVLSAVSPAVVYLIKVLSGGGIV